MSSNTIIPWLIGGLLLLVILSFSLTLKSWREAKRSPYFFLRVQAAKKMQTYMLASIVLFLATMATTAYAWNVPEDTTPRVALIARAKPISQFNELRSPTITSTTELAEAAAAPSALQISTFAPINQISGPLALTDPLLQPRSLPDEYNELESQAESTEATKLGSIAFSTDTTNDYQPIDPTNRFVAGYLTVYATFSYEGMVNGMAWSWVWRWNGEVIAGGNQLWDAGDAGPGYVYYGPEEGFRLGEYTLEIWVNGQLLTQGSLTMMEGITAGN